MSNLMRCEKCAVALKGYICPCCKVDYESEIKIQEEKNKKFGEKMVLFLKGLEKLTIETGIKIHGCGCCGSPFLREIEYPTDNLYGYSVKENGYDIEWVDWFDEDSWNDRHKSIVK